MNALGRPVAAVRLVRAAQDVSRPADADTPGAPVPVGYEPPPDTVPRSLRGGPGPSRTERRAHARSVQQLHALAWRGPVPPIADLYAGRPDVLRVAARRAERLRHAVQLDGRTRVLCVSWAPCAAAVVASATGLGAATIGSDADRSRSCRRRLRRSETDRAAALHRTARALSRSAVPAPPRGGLRTGCAVALGP